MELQNLLKLHYKWLKREKGGVKADFSGQDLRHADLSNSHLCGLDFTGADLSDADLFNANLAGTNLNYAYLTNANLYMAYLYKTNFIGADLSGAEMAEVNGVDSYFGHARF